ncbi:hypothetical protein QJS10_CPA06g02039 [Acorus calamus]|uniref:Methyltransferase type 11 domain-containing protein n=1 Tax=Acorus calamus TaxID=4465 RepID=A0AAV9EK47_ACOCL|nr:hypothetical protein QJS10_CPA06g02039 [Acorus calamus]
MARRKGASEAELLETLGDFTSKENWDKFFTIRGRGDSFEWYAEWPSLRDPLLSQLGISSDSGGGGKLESLEMLVPGCGSSQVSEYLYDEGFRRITNIDFSKVAISDMLRRNVRARPEMRWRVMDMTELQFADGYFDVVLDKGGLDALMEPEHGAKLGSLYLKEVPWASILRAVKRVLKVAGKFICLTLAESHVLGLLFSKFKYGWKTHIHAIPNKSSDKHSFQTFMVVAVKENSDTLNPVISLFDHSALDCNKNQIRSLTQLIENENKLRNECSLNDAIYSLEDLQLGVKGDLKELTPGRRIQISLGEPGCSRFSYKAVLLDSHHQSDPFSYHCGVFIVPKVFLELGHDLGSMDDIKKDLSPLVKNLACVDDAPIPFMTASDGIAQRKIVHETTSATTGPIIVEDVIYESATNNEPLESDDKIFRRLTFQRSLGLVQSEALLVREKTAQSNLSGTERKKNNISSKTKRKRSQKRDSSSVTLTGLFYLTHVNKKSNVTDTRYYTALGCLTPQVTYTLSMIWKENHKVDHTYLASSYHSGIISGFSLIAHNLVEALSSESMVKTIIVGLGAGLFPMFLHLYLPFLDIEVHIMDGIQFVKEKSSIGEDQGTSSVQFLAERKGNNGMKIIIVDADSADSSSGLTCPPAVFLEESFLVTVKKFLSGGGLFVINLVTRSPSIRETVVSKLKTVFNSLFSLELEEDVNMVLFALPVESSIETSHLPEAMSRLQGLLKFTQQEGGHDIIETVKKIKCLK